MKKAFLLIAVAAFSFALPSCKKCTTCEITTAGVTQNIGEVCGKKTVIDAHEANCNQAATVGGGTCNCSKS